MTSLNYRIDLVSSTNIFTRDIIMPVKEKYILWRHLRKMENVV